MTAAAAVTAGWQHCPSAAVVPPLRVRARATSELVNGTSERVTSILFFLPLVCYIFFFFFYIQNGRVFTICLESASAKCCHVSLLIKPIPVRLFIVRRVLSSALLLFVLPRAVLPNARSKSAGLELPLSYCRATTAAFAGFR